MKKKFLIKGLFICFIAAILSACNKEPEIELIGVEAYSNIYRSLPELANEATGVIRVEVLNRRVELRTANPYEEQSGFTEAEARELLPRFFGRRGGWDWISRHGYEIVTVYRIKVLEVFQGTYQVDSIMEVMRPGGTFGHVSIGYTPSVFLVIGDDLVLFIRSRGQIDRPSVLVNPRQSVYRFPDGENIDLSVALENVYEGNFVSDFDVTLNDLLQLAENQD